LFLVFNRPDTTAQVFEEIRKAEPPRLYIAADGPRANREGEAEKVAKVRKIVTEVDWPCEVKTLFREENLGCKQAVSGGIDWFFEHEEQGIILEDDCLPHQDFFYFCDELLRLYALDDRVSVITGNNFQDGIKRGEASYYFSKYNHIWGWATWRHEWQHYQSELLFWPEWSQTNDWLEMIQDPIERNYWSQIFEQMYAGKIDTWDYPWTASIWYNGGLTATPNVNLVSNIGFGPDATHTKSVGSSLIAKSTGAIGILEHPAEIVHDKDADRYVFDNTFGGKSMRFPRSIFQPLKRFVRWLQKILRRSIT